MTDSAARRLRPLIHPALMERIDGAFPNSGECAFCGDCLLGARHRVIDAIASRFIAGDDVALLADDYGISHEAVAVAPCPDCDADRPLLRYVERQRAHLTCRVRASRYEQSCPMAPDTATTVYPPSDNTINARSDVMENPATWGKAEKIVNDALNRAEENHRNLVCGLSTVRLITDALREAGLLTDGNEAHEVPE